MVGPRHMSNTLGQRRPLLIDYIVINFSAMSDKKIPIVKV